MHTITDSKMVHDRVRFEAGGRTITLRVDRDARQLVLALNAVKDEFEAITPETMDTKMAEAARAYATAIFGEKQTDQLFDLYANPVSVVNVCGQYFSKYLSKLITKAQKG